MVKERYVSYEVAKLLKDKGFNEDYPKGDCTQYGCTQQMACDWIGDKYKIHIVVQFVSGKGYSGIICDVSDTDDAFYIVETGYYFSVEQVYNDALEYTLTNLI